MFRKPKAKGGNARQRIAVTDENDDGTKVAPPAAAADVINRGRDEDEASDEEPVSGAPTSLLSFDHEEGVLHIAHTHALPTILARSLQNYQLKTFQYK